MIDDTVEEIEDMQTHSSSDVALKAAAALRSVLDGEYATTEEYLRTLERNARTLRHADTSHASLYTTTKRITEAVRDNEPTTVSEAKAQTEAAIDEERARIETATAEAATRAAEEIPAGGTILTFDFSSTVLTAISAAASTEEPLTVYVMEARPRWLGRKMARRLGQLDGVEPVLIVDNAAGTVIDGVDLVLTGMTCVVEGTLYNRVGTFPLALTAANAAVPMYATGAETKLVEDPFVFEAEPRPVSEVSLEPMDDVAIENPAYDATPVELLSGIITDEGITHDAERRL